MTFSLDRVVHVEAVLIFLYLISTPVSITVFTAFRGSDEGIYLSIYEPRSQSAVVVENACVRATISTAASARRVRTASRLASQRVLRLVSLDS
jgi:hypothetical protein